MKNVTLRKRTEAAIDDQVTKVLKGLGNPEPPLRLVDVRELLRLDQRYYSSTDDGPLLEMISRLKVAGKQVLERPSLVKDAIKALDLKALYLPDQKRILLDKEQPQLKQRWNETHEIVHSLLPWHGSFMYGDNQATLTPTCHEMIEAEANFGSGRLLFLQDRFKIMARDSPSSIEFVQVLHKHFGNTLTSTLWRYVEQSDEIMVAVVSVHPHYVPDKFDATAPCRYFVTSSKFDQLFAGITEVEIFRHIGGYCSYKKRGPLGSGEVILTDVNDKSHEFNFETFSNTYDALTLGVYKRPCPFIL